MLPKRERLTRASLFTRAYNGRKSVSSQFFTLYVLPKIARTGQKAASGSSIAKESERKQPGVRPLDKMPLVRMPLAGFVIAKKVSKSACKRNRAKRRVREAYRLTRHETPEICLRLEQWYALVFVLHDKSLGGTWEEIRGALTSCLDKAELKFGPRPGGRPV